MKVLIIVAAIIFYVAFCIANYIFAKRKYKKFADYYAITNMMTSRQIIIVNVLTSMFSFVSLIVNYLAYKQLKKKFSC